MQTNPKINIPNTQFLYNLQHHSLIHQQTTPKFFLQPLLISLTKPSYQLLPNSIPHPFHKKIKPILSNKFFQFMMSVKLKKMETLSIKTAGQEFDCEAFSLPSKRKRPTSSSTLKEVNGNCSQLRSSTSNKGRLKASSITKGAWTTE